MTALEKAESALHRGGYVMNTGAAFPPDFRPWPRTSGPWSPTPGRPVIAGVEATGEVLEAGKGVALTPGTRVTVFLVDGAWRQEITMDAELAVPDYAEVCVKPRICGDGLRSWGVLVDFSA